MERLLRDRDSPATERFDIGRNEFPSPEWTASRRSARAHRVDYSVERPQFSPSAFQCVGQGLGIACVGLEREGSGAANAIERFLAPSHAGRVPAEGKEVINDPAAPRLRAPNTTTVCGISAWSFRFCGLRGFALHLGLRLLE